MAARDAAEDRLGTSWRAAPMDRSAGGVLVVADELRVERDLAVGTADGDDLVALAEDQRAVGLHGLAVAHDRQERARVGHGDVRGAPTDRRRPVLEVRLDDLELALERRQAEQLVDRDVLLD